MIIGCYDLHLYCDDPDHEWVPPGPHGQVRGASEEGSAIMKKDTRIETAESVRTSALHAAAERLSSGYTGTGIAMGAVLKIANPDTEDQAREIQRAEHKVDLAIRNLLDAQRLLADAKYAQGMLDALAAADED